MKKTKLFAFLGALALVAGIGFGIGLTEEKPVEEVKAAALEPVTLKLDSSTWGSANAYYSIHYWGGESSSSWPGTKFNNGKSASGSAEITANWDPTSTNCIIIRWGNSNLSTEWNRWDYYDKNSFTPGSYNYFTNTGWTNCNGSKVSQEITKHTVNFYDYEGNLNKTEQITDNTEFAPIFIEREGYRLEGWYTEQTLTNKFAKGTLVTTDLNLYPKYVEATDYTVYVLDSKNLLTAKPNVHLWRSQLDGGAIDTWPGLATTDTSVAGVYSIEIDASKSCDSIIFNGGNEKPQTIDLTLATEDTLYVLGAKDTEGKYSASTVTVSVAGLSEYIMAEDTEGQCVAKYPIANTVYLLLSAEEQETFTTDAAHADAKTRYEAWALSLGQTPYVAMSSTKGLLTKMTSENNLMVVILVITASAIACAVAFKLVKKSRKEN